MIRMVTIVEAAKKQELIDQHVILFRISQTGHQKISISVYEAVKSNHHSFFLRKKRQQYSRQESKSTINNRTSKQQRSSKQQ